MNSKPAPESFVQTERLPSSGTSAQQVLDQLPVVPADDGVGDGQVEAGLEAAEGVVDPAAASSGYRASSESGTERGSKQVSVGTRP